MAATTETSAPADTCGTCKTWTATPEDRMTELGFGNCAHLPCYHYLAGRARCTFNPSRFVPKESPREAP